MLFHLDTVDSAFNEIASNELPDLKKLFSSPSVIMSLLFLAGCKEILLLKIKETKSLVPWVWLEVKTTVSLCTTWRFSS